MWKKIVWVLLILIMPQISALQITEIMYNPSGGDEGYEWVEVYNNGESTDFCEYKFYEAETNHKLNAGSCNFDAGEYVIIADVLDNLNFDANIFDSSWQSLSNTGETLCIRDSEKNDIDCVTYSSELGAKGDDMSLQRVNDIWCSGTPTPGNTNSCSNTPSIIEEETVDENIQEPKQEIVIEEKPIVEKSIVVIPDKHDELIKELEDQIDNLELEVIELRATPPVSGEVVWTARESKSAEVSTIMLLGVSILLNVLLIIYTWKK